jgi:hypothetical protein
MAEEAPGGRVDPVGAAAEIDPVQVEFEDLVLREAPLQRQRQHRLAQLAAECAGVGEEDVAGELLSDRGAALAPSAGVDPDLDRAGKADRIDARMGR